MLQISSLYDETRLDCSIRDHQPTTQTTVDSSIALKRDTICGAIIAHPYAPFGGSFRDPVVTAVGESFWQKGFVVGVFNFRFISHFSLL